MFTIMLILQPAASVWGKLRVGLFVVIKSRPRGGPRPSQHLCVLVNRTSSSRDTWALSLIAHWAMAFTAAEYLLGWAQGTLGLRCRARCQGQLWLDGGHPIFALFSFGPQGTKAEPACVCLFTGIKRPCGKRRQEVVERQEDIFHKRMKFSPLYAQFLVPNTFVE